MHAQPYGHPTQTIARQTQRFSEESGFTGFGPQNKLESPPVKISLNPQNLNPTEHLTSCQHHFAALGIIKFRFIQLYMLNEFYNE